MTPATTRVVNVHREPATLYIGRGTVFGNPFTHLQLNRTTAIYKCATRRESILSFEEWVFKQPNILSCIDSLRGKTLGCHCVPLPCHGTIYVRLVMTYDEMRALGIEPDWTTPEGIGIIRRHYNDLKRRTIEAELHSDTTIQQ